MAGGAWVCMAVRASRLPMYDGASLGLALDATACIWCAMSATVWGGVDVCCLYNLMLLERALGVWDLCVLFSVLGWHLGVFIL